MAGLRAAITFLTVVPAPGGGGDRSDAARAVAWYAPVGVVIGAALAGCAVGLWEVAPPLAAAVLTIVAGAVLTGALHIDGLADTADALFVARPRAERLAILRDAHHGTYAVVTIVAVVLLKVSALTGGDGRDAAALVLLATVSARAWLVASMAMFPAARPDGMGAAARSGATPAAISMALAIGAGTAYVAVGWQGLLLGGGLLLLTCGAGWWLTRAFGGLSGDHYGAMIETVEAVALLAGMLAMANGGASAFPIGGV